jgi:hypothetical protein
LIMQARPKLNLRGCAIVLPLVIGGLVFLAACGGRAAARAALATVGQVVPHDLEESPRSEALSAKEHRLEGELAAVKADLATERDKWPRIATEISAGFLTLGCIACFVASIFMPIMKKRLLLGGIACAAGVAVAITIRQSLPLMPWIGGAIVVLGIGATLPTFVKTAKAYIEPDAPPSPGV